jgi:hypothetical protein
VASRSRNARVQGGTPDGHGADRPDPDADGRRVVTDAVRDHLTLARGDRRSRPPNEQEKRDDAE